MRGEAGGMSEIGRGRRTRASVTAAGLTMTMFGASALGAPGVARADDHAPPPSSLRADGAHVQDGLLGTYCWMYASGSGLVQQCAHYPWRFPSIASVPYASDLALRFETGAQPIALQATAWALTDRDEPRGPGESVPVAPAYRDGVWEADIDLLLPCRTYFISVSGWWDDVDGLGRQDAHWTFAVTQTLLDGLDVPRSC